MKLITFLKREKANGYPIINKEDVDRKLKELEDKEHKCSHSDWSDKHKDWICKCGKTRRQHLQELNNY